MRNVARLTAIVGTLLLACDLNSAGAQTLEQFYKGRQLSMIVFTGAGSAYDVYARILARHMGNHIPGKPTFIVQTVQGAGGLKAIDYIYQIAPKDGTVMGTVGRGLPFEPFLGKNEIRFDPLQFVWLGSMNREAALAMSWHTSKVKTFADIKTTELLVPGTGAGADSEIIPHAFNNLVGTKFKIVAGYKDSSEAALAMERGEIDGMAYWSWSAIMTAHPDWVRDNKVNLLFHTGTAPIPARPEIPLIRNMEMKPTDKKALDFLLAREILGRPFLATPGMPPDRAAALRAAFAATLRDPEFRKDAERSSIDFELVTAEEVDNVLKEAASAPAEVIDRVKEVLNRK
jgi:tripartite-type tricarboxylate transporter receptor subunit TctC